MRSSIIFNILAVYAISATAAPVGNTGEKTQTASQDAKPESLVGTAVDITQEATKGNVDFAKVSQLLRMKLVSDLTSAEEKKASISLSKVELQCCFDAVKDTPTCALDKCLEAIARTQATHVDMNGDAMSLANSDIIGDAVKLLNADTLMSSKPDAPSTEEPKMVPGAVDGSKIAQPVDGLTSKAGLSTDNLLPLPVNALLDGDVTKKLPVGLSKRQQPKTYVNKIEQTWTAKMIKGFKHVCDKAKTFTTKAKTADGAAKIKSLPAAKVNTYAVKPLAKAKVAQKVNIKAAGPSYRARVQSRPERVAVAQVTPSAAKHY
ncbi:hypothetical protein H072_2731 [Dactylellina haptotyla CBS 200.50]|uniref:Uncharacterized protein n=1 Tax=Dactylellina haptotyla (strain CBS 200.50) TaxID=1284197 RepID=S8AK27_DACHA|nr:hypothetical protein H072_2731 [Dactylellina haptotyla CBS 200.50]